MAGQVSGSKLAHHIFFMTGRTVGLKARRRNDLGFMRRVQPDEKLSVVTGGEPLPRSELTKRLWNYIQKNGLQDKNKKCLIHADTNLKPVFNGKAQVNMFEMTKLVMGHLLQDADQQSASS